MKAMTSLFDFSGGMESAAMVYLCRDEIKASGAIVRWANTGKQFPEMVDSIAQIESICGFSIVQLQPYITFDQYLFERGGMLREGYSDCSRRMKRKALREHANDLPFPQRIAIGYNAEEVQRGEDFCERNNRYEKDGSPRRLYHYPLQDLNVTRAKSVDVCVRAGFSILVGMYQKMGRFDCYFCPNQRISQAEKVMKHYPSLWSEWKEIERRKGHPILNISAEAIEKRAVQDDFIAALERKQSCSCMGGLDGWDDDP